MLHIVDNWLPETLLQSLRDLCVAHGALKQNLDSDALFSWRPDSGRARSSHAPEQQAVMDTYLHQHLRPSFRFVQPTDCVRLKADLRAK